MSREIDTLQKKIERRAEDLLRKELVNAVLPLSQALSFLDGSIEVSRNGSSVCVTRNAHEVLDVLIDAAVKARLPWCIEQETRRILELVEQVAELAQNKQE